MGRWRGVRGMGGGEEGDGDEHGIEEGKNVRGKGGKEGEGKRVRGKGI